jgi:hypothetical protein
MPNVQTPDAVAPFDGSSKIHSLPPEVWSEAAEPFRQFQQKYHALTEQLQACDTNAQDAELNRRKDAVRSDPSTAPVEMPESEAEYRARCEDLHRTLSHLRSEVVQHWAPLVSALILPIITRHISGFRAECARDWAALAAKWRVPYSAVDNLALRGIDRFMADTNRLLTVVDFAAQNRWPPHWQSLLPTPGQLAELCGPKLAAAPAPLFTDIAAEPKPAVLRTAAEIAAAA